MVLLKIVGAVVLAAIGFVLWWVGGEVYDYFTMRRAFKYNVYADEL